MANNQNQTARAERNAQALVTVQPPRLPMPKEALAEGINEGQWKALTDAVFPSAKSVDGVLLAIRYANARKLDIFKRVVHVVPMWNSALQREVETVWPGIAEMRTTASRTGLHAGNDDCAFGPDVTRKFMDKQTRSKSDGRGGKESYVIEESCPEMTFPEWAQITVYKMVGGVRVPFVGPKVRFTETFSGTKGLNVPNTRWQRAPYQMLEKCAEAAALRRAFPDELGDEWSADEMEGKDLVTAPGTVEGEYTVLAGEGDEAGTATARPKRNEKTAEEIRAEEIAQWWGPSGLDDFMSYMETGLAEVTKHKGIDRALRAEAEAIAMLPKAEKERLDGFVTAARERIGPLPAQQDGDSAAESHDEGEAPLEPEDNEDPDDAARYERYLAQLERFCAEAATPVDVNSLKSREKTAVDSLPPDYKALADELFDAAMEAAKNVRPLADVLAARRREHESVAPGEPAAPATDQALPPEEEK